MRQYLIRETRRALTPTGGFLHGFAYSLNPYVGCAFGAGGGCPFCYVRMLPVAGTIKGEWGAWVIAKTNAPEILERELASLSRSGKLRDCTVFMSSATDPYQGIERRLGITRRLLQAFARNPPHRVVIQTRSPLIERDVDVIREMGRCAVASITIETDDDVVRRRLTPTSSSISRRVAVARRLRSSGIFTQVVIAPMLPNNPQRFAEIVSDAADRVIIDTYFAGDGSGGRRSRALGIGELYEKFGYRDWFQPGAEADLIDAMRARFGCERVLFSRAGFNAV